MRGLFGARGPREYRARSESGKSMPGVLAGGHVRDRFGARGFWEYRARPESGKSMTGVMSGRYARSVWDKRLQGIQSEVRVR